MINLSKKFLNGLKNTLRLNNGVNFSYKGPWVLLYPDTLLDSWYIGDFSAAEYTIVIDLNETNKEIIKCLVTAGVDNATIVTYGRTNLGTDLANISATVNESKVNIILNPELLGTGSKVIFSANYYYSTTQI